MCVVVAFILVRNRKVGEGFVLHILTCIVGTTSFVRIGET